MRDGRLNDAAIAVNKALLEARVTFGIFGGFAVGVHGGPRESKDIDCVVNCQKEWLVTFLSSKKDFLYTNNTRPDYAAFFWGNDKPGNGVLIEFFPIVMTPNMTPQTVTVQGESLGSQVTQLLDVGFVYKGKLRAAAMRGKHSDAADLIFLESRYTDYLKGRATEFSRYYVGLALKRFPHLEHSFVRVNIDVKAAKVRVQDVELDALPTPQPNDVQNGLLFGLIG